MGKQGKKPILYVCCSLVSGKAVSVTIECKSLTSAISKFKDTYGVKPDDVHGPFFYKRPTNKDKVRDYEFEGKSKRAIYKGWFVTAFFLKDQPTSAFLLFDKRVDGQRLQRPIGDIIVKLNELEDLIVNEK